MIPAAATLEEFGEHVNVSTPDAELWAMLEAATEAAEGRVGPIVARSATARVTSVRGVLRLPAPVASIQSVTGLFGTEDLVAADLDVDPTTGVVRYAATGASVPSGTYEVVFTVGRWATTYDVPASLRLAVMVIGKHLWETQRGQTKRPGSLRLDEMEPPPIGYALPHRATQLLQPYVPLLVG